MFNSTQVVDTLLYLLNSLGKADSTTTWTLPRQVHMIICLSLHFSVCTSVSLYMCLSVRVSVCTFFLSERLSV